MIGVPHTSAGRLAEQHAHGIAPEQALGGQGS